VLLLVMRPAATGDAGNPHFTLARTGMRQDGIKG
jgi:hypothetical protein